MREPKKTGVNNTEEVNDFIAANVTSHVTHDNSVQFLCAPCGKLYRGKHSVRDHVSVHHVNVGRRYGCPMCEGVFTNRNSLRNHIAKNHSELDTRGLNYEQFLFDDEAAKAAPEAGKEKSKVISVTRVGRKNKEKDTAEKQGNSQGEDVQGSPISTTETEEAPLTNTNAATKDTQESLGSRQDPKANEITEFLNSNVTKRNGTFTCNPCGKAYKSHGGAYAHVRDRHVMAGQRYQCPKWKCPTNSSNKNSIKSHISQKHPELAGTGVDYR